MSYYSEVYKKRLNRYGDNYQSRIQGQREREFQDYLTKSAYRLDFEYDGQIHPGTLQKYKQNETQTMGYFLTRVNLNIPNGTLLMLPDKDMIQQPWMIWWLESMKASGYNRYVVLKMSHKIQWQQDGEHYCQWMYFYGPGTTKVQDMTKGRRMGGSAYAQNNNLYMFITSANFNIKKDTYFEILNLQVPQDLKTAFRVTEIDLASTKGIGYYSVDPIYLFDHSPKPQQKQTDKDEDFYWLNGGGD